MRALAECDAIASGLLLLLPGDAEWKFWSSPKIQHQLAQLDRAGCFCAILNNMLLTYLVWKERLESGRALMGPFLVVCAVFVLLAAAQIVASLWAPSSMARHRTLLALFNRLSRVALQMSRFRADGPLVVHGLHASGRLPSHLSILGTCRVLVTCSSHMISFLNVFMFLLPFRLSLAVQLLHCTLAMEQGAAHVRDLVAAHPPLEGLLQRSCATLADASTSLQAVALSDTTQVHAFALRACEVRGPEIVQQLQIVVLLLLAPLLATWPWEARSKAEFVQQRDARERGGRERPADASPLRRVVAWIVSSALTALNLAVVFVASFMTLVVWYRADE